MKWNELNKENCPVARGLSAVGDRWNMLILRDCFLGIRRFDAFQAKLGITRHILTDRLRKLVSMGILRKEKYMDHPPRYEYRLTEKGMDLYPVILALINWAEQHQPTDAASPFTLLDRETGEPITPVMIDTKTGKPVDARKVRAQKKE